MLMARPSSGSNLSLAALASIMDSRRSELNKLRKQRTEAQRELDAIERQIHKIEGSSGRGGNGRARNSKSLNETLADVLKAGGKPMSVGDILDAVEATGYRSRSDNFRGIINQTLIKDKRFGAASRGVYQLKK
jgi:HPt (histidine-containing phosphotransfer) domain-containing protein